MLVFVIVKTSHIIAKLQSSPTLGMDIIHTRSGKKHTLIHKKKQCLQSWCRDNWSLLDKTSLLYRTDKEMRGLVLVFDWGMTIRNHSHFTILMKLITRFHLVTVGLSTNLQETRDLCTKPHKQNLPTLLAHRAMIVSKIFLRVKLWTCHHSKPKRVSFPNTCHRKCNTNMPRWSLLMIHTKLIPTD